MLMESYFLLYLQNVKKQKTKSSDLEIFPCDVFLPAASLVFWLLKHVESIAKL